MSTTGCLSCIAGTGVVLLEQAQQDAQVKRTSSACASDILRLAAANGEQAVRNLFVMVDVAVVVDGRTATESCEAMATP